MDATTAFTVIPVTIGVCTILHLLLEKRKNERITFLTEQLTEARRQLEEAKKQSPDILAQTLHNTVQILKSQLTELNAEKQTDKEAHAKAIQSKEQELAAALIRIEELNEQMNTAQGILEEYEYFKDQFSCEHCGAELIRLADNDEMSDVAFACGNSFTSPCPHDPDFPTFNEYELIVDNSHSIWHCSAKPKTKNARKLRLESVWGSTEEQVKQRMLERYKFASKDVPKKT